MNNKQTTNKKIIKIIRKSTDRISEQKKTEQKKYKDFFEKEQRKIVKQIKANNTFKDLLFKAATTHFSKNDKKCE